MFVVVLLGAAWIGLCEGISYDLFYSYGYQFGDVVLERGDDVSSNEISLDVPIVFYDQRYNRIFVSTTMFFALVFFFDNPFLYVWLNNTFNSQLHEAAWTCLWIQGLDTRIKTQ